MIILGIDPGKTSGWCVYDSDERRVVECGMFAGTEFGDEFSQLAELATDLAVLEEPVAHGPTRPEVVECAKTFARLDERIARLVQTETLTRHEIRKRLQLATHGVVRVKDDATVWAALKLLHGDGCDKKGGALYGVRSHARAALAAAVAFGLPASETNKEGK